MNNDKRLQHANRAYMDGLPNLAGFFIKMITGPNREAQPARSERMRDRNDLNSSGQTELLNRLNNQTPSA